MKSPYGAFMRAVVLSLTALPTAAHHSVAINFERGEPIEIRGTVDRKSVV